MIHGSLFAGAGGLDLAVQRLFPGHLAWVSEIGSAASKVLAHRFLGLPNHGDITRIDWAAVEPVDVLTAGWPCQPWSVAGQQKGIEDERALWPYVVGAIRTLRPRIVLLENVANVIAAGELGRVADSLASWGYDLRWTCLRASDAGYCHHRNRIFILAYPADSNCLAVWEQSERESRSGGTPVAGWDRADTADTESDGRGNASMTAPSARACEAGFRESGGSAGGGAAPVVLPTPRASDGSKGGPNQRGSSGDLMLPSAVMAMVPTPAARDHKGPANPAGRVRGGRPRTWGDDMLPDAVLGMPSAWGRYGPAIRRQEAVTGRLAPPPTEPGRSGKPRLAPVFAEWMMGWPSGWVTDPAIGISRTDQLRCIGNGVVPDQAVAAYSYLLSLNGSVVAA